MYRRTIPHLLAFAAALTACDQADAPIDDYPIRFDGVSGALLLPVSEGLSVPVLAVLDTLSPVTVLDPFVTGETTPAVSRRTTDMFLHSVAVPPATPIPRAKLEGVDVLALHPCGAATTTPCKVGPAASPVEISAIIGRNTLAAFALRIDFASSSIVLFPDMPGSNSQRSQSCDAVFPAPFYGGGTMLVGGAEIDFSGHLIALEACLAHAPLASTQIQRGVAALFVVSTATGPTLLSRSAYQRYRTFDSAAPDPDNAPEVTLYLSSGPLSGRSVAIDRMALVAEASGDRGPCRELYANYLLAEDGCTTDGAGADCPCSENATFCRVGAAIELANDAAKQIEVVVISDDEPILQALRAELRPGLPEVDGILGTAALAELELDIDYPNSRLLMRCTGADCASRPSFFTRADLDAVAACTAANPL